MCYYILEVIELISVNKDIFIDRLKKAMDAKRFSNADLIAACQPFAKAKNIQIDRAKISHWTTGRNLPKTYDALEVLGSALEVHPNYFLGMDVTEGITDEERTIICAWREATDYERETIRIILRRYLHENAF